jgi:hypothetical protein
MRTLIPLLLVISSGCFVSFDESLLGRSDGGWVDLPSCSDLRCEGDALFGCSRTLVTCALGCASSPTPHCRSVIPSNGLPAPGNAQSADLRISGVAALESCSGELDGASIPGASFSLKEQAAGPRIGVLRIRSALLRPGARLIVGGSCALALVADRDLEIAGAIDLRGGQNAPFMAGPGGGQGGFTGKAGGCGIGAEVSTAEASGGGGGGFGSDGAKGGKAGAGGGSPGTACGQESSEPLVGGSGGGRGGCVAAACASGYGGGGGGALALVAGRAFTLTQGGELNVGGGGGGGGQNGVSGGGGGGSGGAILIEAASVAIAETARLIAGGGGGGGIAESDPATARGAGGVAGETGAAGGAGLVTGGQGAVAGASAATGNDGASGASGGGGGLGRLRINSPSGSVTVPASTSAKVTQGKVKSE